MISFSKTLVLSWDRIGGIMKKNTGPHFLWLMMFLAIIRSRWERKMAKKMFDDVIGLFKELSKIPRPSGKEEMIRERLIKWATMNGFKCKVCSAGTLLITVEATAGYEKAPIIVVQGHMDKFAIENEDYADACANIKFIQEKDKDGKLWMKTDGKTNLGADNLMGIAIALIIAAAKGIPHPKLELLLTVNEETGLTGAIKMDQDFYNGKIVINVDSEDGPTSFTAGCAGGKDTIYKLRLSPMKRAPGKMALKVSVKAKGGHSGIDINKQTANAIKVLVRVIRTCMDGNDIQIAHFHSGGKRNAIPTDAHVILLLDPDNLTKILDTIKPMTAAFNEEFFGSDVSISVDKLEGDEDAYDNCLTAESATDLLEFLMSMHHGIWAMDNKVNGLVEVSSNLANAMLDFETRILTVVSCNRGSRKSRFKDMLETMDVVAKRFGAEIIHEDGYPGWVADFDSHILKNSMAVGKKMFGSLPELIAFHAGIELGVVVDKAKGKIHAFSLGPLIYEPHTPRERVEMKSIFMCIVLLIGIFKAARTWKL